MFVFSVCFVTLRYVMLCFVTLRYVMFRFVSLPRCVRRPNTGRAGQAQQEQYYVTINIDLALELFVDSQTPPRSQALKFLFS